MELIKKERYQNLMPCTEILKQQLLTQDVKKHIGSIANIRDLKLIMHL